MSTFYTSTIPMSFTGEIATRNASVVFPVTVYHAPQDTWVVFPSDWRRLAVASGLVDRGYDVFDERTERVIDRLIRWQFKAHLKCRWSLLGHRGCALAKTRLAQLDAELARANAELLGETVAA